MSINSYQHRIYKAEQPGSPLLFVFHGTGGDENQFFDFGRHLLPDAGLFRPAAMYPSMAPRAFSAARAKASTIWTTSPRARAPWRNLFARTRTVRSQSNVIGLGYSNGANILASVMLSHPELFDEAILMHPLVPWTPAPQTRPCRQARIDHRRAKLDTICPPELTQILCRLSDLSKGLRPTLSGIPAVTKSSKAKSRRSNISSAKSR